MSRIVSDLVALRKSAQLSQRALATKIGISYTTVQDIETGGRGIWIEDLAKWLDACGSSITTYFNQTATADELKALKKDRELADQFRKALKNPQMRDALKGFFAVLFSYDESIGKGTE